MAGIQAHVALRWALAGVAASALAGCSGRPEGAERRAAASLGSETAGYVAPPEPLAAMLLRDGQIRVAGRAPAHAAVEVVSPEGEVERVDADRRGLWSVRLPGGRPHLYALSAVIGGQTVHAEGGLVTAPGTLAAAVLVRAGDAARPLLRTGVEGIATVDYDASGEVAVAGGAPAHAALELVVDGAPAAAGRADASGRYGLIAANRRLTLGLHRLEVRGASGAPREIQLSPMPPLDGPYQAEGASGGGWRVTWALTGGGEQTTLLLPP